MRYAHLLTFPVFFINETPADRQGFSSDEERCK